MKVEELERLHEAATPGPWWTFYYDAGDKDEYDNCPSIQAPEKEDCAVIHWDGFKQKHWTSANGDQLQIDANAALIVALRNALPDIIAMARERDSYKAALEPFAKSGELLARIGDAGDFWAYRPAGGDEYGITGRHLLDAYTALERRGSQ